MADVIARVSPSMMNNDPDRFGLVDPGFISLVHNNALATATAQWWSLFGLVAAISFGAAVLLVLLVKPTVKLMSGVK